MNPDSTSHKIEVIKNQIYSGNLADAINSLLNLAKNEGNYNAIEQTEKIRDNYLYLLRYMEQGIDDPSRKSQLNSIADQLLSTTEGLQLSIATAHSPQITFATRRMMNLAQVSVNQLIDSLSIEHNKSNSSSIENSQLIRSNLFNTLWTAYANKSWYEATLQSIVNGKISETDAIFILSALTLGLMEFYDSLKLELMIDIYDNTDSDRLAATALTGILLVLASNHARIRSDLRIINRLDNWKDSIVTYTRLRDVVKNIIRTRNTDRASEKMASEVIPELKKMNPEVLKKMKQQGTELDASMIDGNPEWEEMVEKSGIGDKIRELQEMQAEGADMLMITFSDLKKFPFFRDVAAWFLPFDLNNPAIHLPDDIKPDLQSLFELSDDMCDSDKYSLAIAFGMMPEQQRSLMLQGLKTQMDGMREQLAEAISRRVRPEFNLASVIFIRNFYRLYKLFHRKEELNDPFLNPFNFTNIPVVSDIICDTELMKLVAEFYFKFKYYDDALAIFRMIEDSQNNDANYWEKIGYCLQTEGEWQESFNAFCRAELLKEPSDWLLRRLGYTARRAGNFQRAAEYYQRLLDSDPENQSLLVTTANILAEIGNYKQALLYFYHANYLKPDDHNIWSGIAWLEFLEGNLEKSCKYYDKILNNSPSLQDYLNAGHASLASGSISRAMALYRKAAVLDFNNFIKGFNSDRPTLIKLGIEPSYLTLILDAIKLS